jgi:hypothetical protein
MNAKPTTPTSVVPGTKTISATIKASPNTINDTTIAHSMK